MAVISPSPTVFLDKDGTILVDVPYNVDPARMELMPTVREGLALLGAAGYRLAVVSNQSGVGLGRFGAAALEPVEERLRELFAESGAVLSGCFWCTHAPADGCGCRKPAPGLVARAANALASDLGRSWMVGDILDDVEAAHAAGCRAVLVDRGGETVWRDGPLRHPDARTATFLDAARHVASFGSPWRS